MKLSGTTRQSPLAISLCLLLSIALLLHGSQAKAQIAPGSFADANSPSGPPDPEKLDTVWNVNPVSGALDVSISFPTIPVGGRGPQIPFTLLYNSSATMSLQEAYVSNVDAGGGGASVACNSSDAGVETCFLTAGGTTYMNAIPILLENFEWDGPHNNYYTPSGPWTSSGPYQNTIVTTIPAQIYNTQSGGPTINAGNGCTIVGPYLYTDERGETHDMNLEVDTSSTYDTWAPCTAAYSNSLQYGTVSKTADGSAIQTSSGTPIGTYGNPSILYPDGTQFSAPMLEDSNGNQAQMGSDSLGRAPFVTNWPIGQPGAVPPGTYSVTTTGTTGATEPYSITVGTVSIGSFTMPHPQNAEITGEQYCINDITCPVEFGVLQPGVDTSGSSLSAVQSISLPDGQSSYSFQYDPTYATISKITYPTGGYVRFQYGVVSNAPGPINSQFLAYSEVAVTDVYVSPGSGPESHWHYAIPSPAAGYTSRVTTPDGSYTDYTQACFIYSTVWVTGAMPSCKEAAAITYSATGQPLLSTLTQYAGQGLPADVATTEYTDGTALQKQVKYTYDAYENVVEKDESSYYPCTGTPCAVPASPQAGWARKTLANYLWSTPNTTQPAYNYTQAHIVDKPSQISITDGAGNLTSLVQYNYDETALTGSAGILNHDDVNFPATKVGPRGNMTTEKTCVAFSSGSCSGWSITTYQYNLAGQVAAVTDPCGNAACNETAGASHTTTYQYNDVYTYGSPSKPSSGYATTITRPSANGVAHSDQYAYSYYTGGVTAHTDQNSQTTTYSYANPVSGQPDPLNRPGEITLPPTFDGSTDTTASGWTKYTYTDTPGAFSVQSQQLLNASGSVLQKVEDFDGLGRLVTTINSDPDGNTEVDRKYDIDGRLYSVSNPYRTTSDTTYGTTIYSYDPLNRPTSVQNPDGSAKQWCYDGIQTEGQGNCHSTLSTGTGVWVDVADENTYDWQQTTDGLGRLIAVMEPNGTVTANTPPSNETDYQYDVLGNLKQVDQWGGSYGSATDRQRLFNYDGLSRLTSANNPESGTITYSYFTNGALCAGDASLPCGRTDARGVATQYTYDNLNRLIGKSYTGITSPSAAFTYDVSSISGATNTIGKLTGETVGTGSTVISQRVPYAYDAMGRLEQMLECTAYAPATCSGTSYHLAYGYDLAGDVTQWTNGIPNSPFTGNPATTASEYGSSSASFNSIQAPSILLTTNYDSAGRPSLLTSSWSDALNHPATLFQANSTGSAAPAYSAAGGLENAVLGVNAQTDQTMATLVRSYDNRLLVLSETDTGSTVQVAPATASLGTITISGSEQMIPAAGPFSSTELIVVSGSEQSKAVDPQVSSQVTGCGSVTTTSPTTGVCYDGGSGSFVISGGEASGASYSWSYGVGSTASSIATSIIGQINATAATTGVSAALSLAGTSGTATLTIANPNGAAGTIDLYVGNPDYIHEAGPIATLSYPSTATAISIATQLALNIGVCSITSEQLVGATSSGATVTLTSCGTGSSTNYSYYAMSSVLPSTQFTFTGGTNGSGSMAGTPSSLTLTFTQTGTPGSGGFMIFMPSLELDGEGAPVADVSYSSSSSPSTLATSVALSIGQCGASPGMLIGASAAGPVVTITSCAVGTGSTDYVLSTDLMGTMFSVSQSSSTLTGGTDPQSGAGILLTMKAASSSPVTYAIEGGEGCGGAFGFCSFALSLPGEVTPPVASTSPAVYDSGVASATINGVTASYNWGGTDSQASIASGLMRAINVADGGFLNAQASGATIQLTSLTTGAATNWLVTASITHSGAFGSLSYSAAASGMTGGAAASYQPQVVYTYSIPSSGGYYPNGNLESVNELGAGAWAYTYDNLNRLTYASGIAGKYTGMIIAGTTLSWNYDAFGNRLVQNSNVGWYPTGSVQFAGTNNRATGVGLASVPNSSTATLGYDASGDVTYDGSRNYQYDAEGRICLVQDITGGYTQYLYDAEGNRVAKGSVTSLSCDSTTNGFSPTNSYVVGSGGEQVTEFARQGSAWAWSHSNVFGSGGLLATYTGSDIYFAFKDWLGTKRAELTPDGLSTIFASLPFGDGLTSSGTATDATEHHFTGKERDSETGLDDFGARYYASSMARWMSPDWSVKTEPVPYAKLTNPQSLNLYGYVGNNPLSRIDIDGHELVPLGQQTDKQINDLTRQNNRILKEKDLDPDVKDLVKAANRSLSLEKEGNAVASAYLSRLDSVGQRNGLSLTDIVLTTDPANDFAGRNVSAADLARAASPAAQAFVLGGSGPMYLKNNTFTFMNAFDPTSGLMMRDLGGTILRHEQVHQGGGDEPAAYGVQRQVFEHFKPDFTPEAFKSYYDQMHP